MVTFESDGSKSEKKDVDVKVCGEVKRQTTAFCTTEAIKTISLLLDTKQKSMKPTEIIKILHAAIQ